MIIPVIKFGWRGETDKYLNYYCKNFSIKGTKV